MLWTIVLAAVAAAPVKLAAPGLTAVNLTDAEVGFFTEHLAQQLTQQGLQVTTAKQIASILGMERQKELLGCTDASSSCIAELANALGVDGIVTGSVGKFDQAYRITVNIVAASDGRTLASHSGKTSSKDAVLDELTAAAREMAPKVAVALKLRRAFPSPGPGTAPLGSPSAPAMNLPKLRPWWWIPAVASAPFIVLGVVSVGHANDVVLPIAQAGVSGNPLGDYLALKSAADEGDSAAKAAGLAFGIAGAALVVAGGMYLTGSPSEGAVLVVPTASGAAVVGTWR